MRKLLLLDDARVAQSLLDYLESRDLVKVFTDPLGQVSAELTRFGIDIAEYTVDVEPGIARPPKV